jgi:hypothetical protein
MINAKKTFGLVNQRMNLLKAASRRREIGGYDIAEFAMHVLLKITISVLSDVRGRLSSIYQLQTCLSELSRFICYDAGNLGEDFARVQPNWLSRSRN